MAIRDVLMREDLSLTPSEEKIVRLLLTDYPTSGLGTATSLARRAGVSDPTVVRLVMKLGFDGIADFQSKLLAEVEARLHSPLEMMGAKSPDGSRDGVIISYLKSVTACVDKSTTATPPQTYDRAAKLIMEAKGQVVLIGGRFSRHVAGMLAGYLMQFRPGIREVASLSAQDFDTLVDLDKRDVLVVLDYRRYQLDVVAYARQAAARGVRIVLFTDPWLSPIADLAEVVIVSQLEVESPYDSMAPAVAQIEALVAHIVSTMSEATRTRIVDLENVRHANAVTLDSTRRSATEPDSGSGSFGPKRSKKEPKQ
ncbi:MurR/RpiR family transcriptional regulator (plasmid) [Aminobacter sp. UC22_36]|uniref:MurR/RpiR family transcriptional regulator n=1 Tax=Aminobacter sp. UC22_36 TaxID=3374549 RepID=UPI003756302E